MVGGDRWRAEDRFFRTLVHKSSHCVLIEVQKEALCTFQVKKIIGRSFTPSVALLVCLSGTIHPTVNCHGFTRS